MATKRILLITINDFISISFCGKVIFNMYYIFCWFFFIPQFFYMVYVFLRALHNFFLLMCYCFCKRYSLYIVATLDCISVLTLSLTRGKHCSSLNMFQLSAVGWALFEHFMDHTILILSIKFPCKSLLEFYIPVHLWVTNFIICCLHQVHSMFVYCMLLWWISVKCAEGPH